MAGMACGGRQTVVLSITLWPAAVKRSGLWQRTERAKSKSPLMRQPRGKWTCHEMAGISCSLPNGEEHSIYGERKLPATARYRSPREWMQDVHKSLRTESR